MAYGWTRGKIERLKCLRAEGLSCLDIANSFGDISSRTIARKIASLGLHYLAYIRRTPARRPLKTSIARHTHKRGPGLCPKHVTASPVSYPKQWHQQNNDSFTAAMRKAHPDKELSLAGVR